MKIAVLNEVSARARNADLLSVLAEHAIKNAIYDYAQRNGKEYAGLEGFDPDSEHHDDCDACGEE